MIALDVARRAGLETSQDAWHLQRALVDDLATHWQEPDNGLWEIRGPLRHFTHSRVMVWAAFDRAIRRRRTTGSSVPSTGGSRSGTRGVARCSRAESTPGGTASPSMTTPQRRTDERLVGQEWVSQCRDREPWSPY